MVSKIIYEDLLYILSMTIIAFNSLSKLEWDCNWVIMIKCLTKNVKQSKCFLLHVLQFHLVVDFTVKIFSFPFNYRKSHGG